MSSLIVFIEDQIRDVYQRVSLDVDTPSERLVGKLVQEFDLPRYHFTGQQIEYWLERPDGKKRLVRGKRLPDPMTLRQAGIRKGDLLQLVSPEGRRMALIQKILDEIEQEITDRVTGKLKEKVTEEVWKRVKEKLAELEKTHADDKRVQRVRQWVNQVEIIGGPTKLLDIIEKAFDVYKRYGPLAKLVSVLVPVLLIVLASLLPPLPSKTSMASPSPTVTATPILGPLGTTIPVVISTYTPTPSPTMMPALMPTPTKTPTSVPSTATSTPTFSGSSSVTATSTPTPFLTPTPTITVTPVPHTSTLTPTPTFTPTPTPTSIFIQPLPTVNPAPVANDDTATTDQDTPVTINVAANDFDLDLDGGPLTVISVTQGANGTVLNHGNGTVTYTPNVGFYGQDSFTYAISDGEDGTASATVIVTVNPLSADLSVTQSDSPDPVTLSSNLTYNIIVTNRGPSAATGVILTNQLDPGVAFEGITSSQENCSEGHGIVTCILGFLANGDNATVAIVVVPTRVGSVTNTAHVAGNELDASLTNNESIEDTTVTQPDLPPEVTITNPSDDQYVYDGFDGALKLWYKKIVLEGIALDPEDGPLSGPSLVWKTNRTDIQSAILGTGTNATAFLYSNVCTGVEHEITLTATDSDGNSSTAVRKIRIWTVC